MQLLSNKVYKIKLFIKKHFLRSIPTEISSLLELTKIIKGSMKNIWLLVLILNITLQFTEK